MTSVRAGSSPPSTSIDDVGLRGERRRRGSVVSGSAAVSTARAAADRGRARTVMWKAAATAPAARGERGDGAADLAEAKERRREFHGRCGRRRCAAPRRVGNGRHDISPRTFVQPRQCASARIECRSERDATEQRELRVNFRDRTVCRGSYLSRFIGQEVAPGLSAKGAWLLWRRRACSLSHSG